jgi:porin
MISASAYDTPPALVAPAPEVRMAQIDMPRPSPAPGAAPDATQTPTTQPPVATASPVKPRSQNPQDAHLLGDWFGLRTKLIDAGITPTLAYVEHSLSNVRGGTVSRFNTAGQFTAGLQFDMEKLTGFIPGTVQVTAVRRHGDSFNAESGLNLLVNPLSIQGRGQTWRFSQMWYRTSIGKLNIKAGRMFLNEDFNQSRCDFVSGYFCLGDNTRAYSNIWPTSPVSQWAIRLQYPIAKDLTIKTAVYQYNPKNLDMTRNFYVGFKGATGVLLPSEIVYTPKLGGKLPGTYTVGFYYSNAPQNDPVLNTRGQLRLLHGGTAMIRDNEWGIYFDGRQQLTKPNKDGSNALSIFLNASLASQQSTTNRSAISLGMNYTGILPGRPRDEVGLAVGKGRLNDRVTEAARIATANGKPTAVRTNEYVVEAYYGINLAPGFTFQPDAQFIFDPAGDPSRRNAILLGFKTSVVL